METYGKNHTKSDRSETTTVSIVVGKPFRIDKNIEHFVITAGVTGPVDGIGEDL